MANPWPRAKRGLCWVHGREVSKSAPEWQAVEEMQALLKDSPRPDLVGWVSTSRRWKCATLNTVCASWIKYMRVKTGNGRPRSLYYPPSARAVT